MQGFQSGPLFSDGAGGATPLTAAFADSVGAETAFVDQRCELLVDMQPGGDAADGYEFQFLESLDRGTTWRTIPIAYGVDAEGIRYEGNGVYRQTVATAQRWYVQVREQTTVKLQARRVGGTVDTTLYVEAQTREPLPGANTLLPMSSVVPWHTSDTPCFDDGADPPAALAIGAGPGWTDTDGDEWHASGQMLYGAILVQITAAGGETAIQARIRERLAAATAVEYNPTGTNSVVGGVEDVDDHVIDLPLTTLNHSIPFLVKPGMEYAVDFRRTNGGPTALASFHFWR